MHEASNVKFGVNNAIINSNNVKFEVLQHQVWHQERQIWHQERHSCGL